MKKKESEKTVYRNRSFDRSEENDLQLWDDKQKEDKYIHPTTMEQTNKNECIRSSLLMI